MAIFIIQILLPKSAGIAGTILAGAIIKEGVRSLVHNEQFDFAQVAGKSLGDMVVNGMEGTQAEREARANAAKTASKPGDELYNALKEAFGNARNGNAGKMTGKEIQYADSGMIASDASNWQGELPQFSNVVDEPDNYVEPVYDEIPIGEYEDMLVNGVYDEISNEEMWQLKFGDQADEIQQAYDNKSGRTLEANGHFYTNQEVDSIMNDVINQGVDMNPARLAEAKKLFLAHGFRTGIISDSELVGTEGLIDAYAGKGAGAIGALQRSARQYLNSDELDMRYDFFTNNKMTKVDVFGNRRTITVSSQTNPDTWDTHSLAGQVGVSIAEAKAKIEWGTYKRTMNAAFDTSANGMQISSIEFSGYWRPTTGLWTSLANSKGWNIDTKADMLALATIKTQYPGIPDWGAGHSSGTAIDIANINGNSIRNQYANPPGSSQEPALIKEFSRQLKSQGAVQIFQPWETYSKTTVSGMGKSILRTETSNDFLNNINSHKIEKRHNNHLHVDWGN